MESQLGGGEGPEGAAPGGGLNLPEGETSIIPSGEVLRARRESGAAAPVVAAAGHGAAGAAISSRSDV